MIDLLDRLMHIAAANRGWAGPAFGLLAFGESLAVVGIIIPATPALFFIGTLLGSGQIDPAIVLPWIIAGAIAGYWLSWSAGRRMGHAVYRTRVVASHRRGVARTRLFFRRWGGPSLIVGRYLLGPLQSTLPLVAGVAGMGARRFHLWNVASGILWPFVVLAPGYLAARGVTLFGFGIAQQRLLVPVLLAVSLVLMLAVIGTSAAHLFWKGRSGARPKRRA